MNKKKFIIIIIVLIIMTIIVYFVFNNNDDKLKIENNNNNIKQITNPIMYFKLAINGKILGNIEFELYENIVPKTTANFKQLCMKNDKGIKKYKGTIFHRIVKGFVIQGGDFTKGDGTGGRSIYGLHFDDENFVKKHNKKGLLSMANSGPNTNGSQFFITLDETPHLDNKHVVFGEVINGYNLVEYISQLDVNESDKPIEDVMIIDCGQK